VSLERFSAAWREAYVSSDEAKNNARNETVCVFCVLAKENPSLESGVLLHSTHAYLTLNAFPYGSGHLLILPKRHVANLHDLTEDEYRDFTGLIRSAATAIDTAYRADGMNIGLNLGQAAGAGIPKHLHAHVLPRWNGDTNFMTSIGETRVLPESLASTYEKVWTALNESIMDTNV
jgi:ATP adenylyltransferase